MKTEKWAGLSPRYRSDLEPVLTYLRERIGKRDVARLSQADIFDAMDANQHRVRFANYIPTAISMLSKLAIRKRWRTDNPALGVEPLKVPKGRRKPHPVPSHAAVDRWRTEAQPLPLLIFEIGVGSVQRPGDWVDFTWGDYDGQSLILEQNKTETPLKLPCTNHLRGALDRAKAALPVSPLPSCHILTKADGTPMDYDYMSRIMRKERERLGMLQAFDNHGLRYRGVKELAWAGCDDDEIASYSGHTSRAMIRKYAGEARQEMRARTAHAKRNRT
jgi:integrase